MESFVERLDTAAETLERHATEKIGVLEKSSRMNDQRRTVGGHGLRAVDQVVVHQEIAEARRHLVRDDLQPLEPDADRFLPF